MFWYDGTNWYDGENLTAADGAEDDGFGISVSLDGDTAVIGAPGSGSTGSGEEDWIDGPGAAYVFRYAGEAWGPEKRLTAFDGAPEELFGYSVAMSGDTVVIGAPRSGTTEFVDGNGAAYVFRHNGASWVSQGTLIASAGADEDRFGS